MVRRNEITADFNNRAAQLPTTSGAHLVAANAIFDDSGAHVTNNVTFQVDMSTNRFLTISPMAGGKLSRCGQLQRLGRRLECVDP